MARIAGVNIEDKWRVGFGLTRIRGIGWTSSSKILEGLSIDGSKKIGELTNDELSKIAHEVDKYPTEGELARRVRSGISRLRTIGSYRGIRHTRGLPVRGQRTRTNARTKRGKRKTVGAFKKEDLAKQSTSKKEA